MVINTRLEPSCEIVFFPRCLANSIQWNIHFYWMNNIGIPSKLIFYVLLYISLCWNIYEHALWLLMQEFIQIYSILLFVLCWFLLINFLCMNYKGIHSNLFDITVCFCITIIHQNTTQMCTFKEKNISACVLQKCLLPISMSVSYNLPMSSLYYPMTCQLRGGQ